MDKYLNNEFLSTLSSIENHIIDSVIVITDKDSIGRTGDLATTITRKVFLLSRTELGMKESNIAVTEGVALKYYIDILKKDTTLRIATPTSGEAKTWWLRTPETWSFNLVYAVAYNGGIGTATIGGTEVAAFGNYYYGVRPAFCLASDTAIYEGEVNGELVYITSFGEAL